MILGSGEAVHVFSTDVVLRGSVTDRVMKVCYFANTRLFGNGFDWLGRGHVDLCNATCRIGDVKLKRAKELRRLSGRIRSNQAQQAGMPWYFHVYYWGLSP